jgi:hypothetical protein
MRLSKRSSVGSPPPGGIGTVVGAPNKTRTRHRRSGLGVSNSPSLPVMARPYAQRHLQVAPPNTGSVAVIDLADRHFEDADDHVWEIQIVGPH